MTAPGQTTTANDPPSLIDSAGRRDRFLLIGTRTARGFGAGALSIVIALDLARVGYSSFAIGVLLGLALGGAAGWAIIVPRIELRWRPRSVLALSAAALAIGGVLLWVDVANPAFLLAALLLGGIVAGGADVSPLGALEQAALATTTPDAKRTQAYAIYNLLGYVGVAVGALAAGPLTAYSGPAIPGLPPSPHDATFSRVCLFVADPSGAYRGSTNEGSIPGILAGGARGVSDGFRGP